MAVPDGRLCPKEGELGLEGPLANLAWNCRVRFMSKLALDFDFFFFFRVSLSSPG